MKEFSSQKIADFMADIQSLSVETYELAVAARDLHFEYASDLTEDIKYGGLVFFRGKDLLGGIFIYKEHISIEFSYGINLSDPCSVLEGKGKLRRHIKLRALGDIEAKNVAHYVKEAVVAA